MFIDLDGVVADVDLVARNGLFERKRELEQPHGLRLTPGEVHPPALERAAIDAAFPAKHLEINTLGAPLFQQSCRLGLAADLSSRHPDPPGEQDHAARWDGPPYLAEGLPTGAAKASDWSARLQSARMCARRSWASSGWRPFHRIPASRRPIPAARGTSYRIDPCWRHRFQTLKTVVRVTLTPPPPRATGGSVGCPGPR